MKFCSKKIKTTSKILCKLEENHKGKCNAHPYLQGLELDIKNSSASDKDKKLFKKIVDKIKQDSYNTRGNTTKPFKNRSFRWDTPISKDEALKMKKSKSTGIPKKEFATEVECYKVAQKLTRLIYEMKNAPKCPENIIPFLDKTPDPIKNPCICPLCKEKLNINDFLDSIQGQAKLELWHLEPLTENVSKHNAQNISWGHRECNVAQGDRSTNETLEWMKKIIKANKML
jgi:hypothetical protein